MSIAVELHCICRRKIANYELGAELIKTSRRTELRDGVGDPWNNLNGLFAPAEIEQVILRCGNCNAKNIFKESEFNAAIGQNRLNGKPAKVFGSSVAQRNP
jgi:hypothetical protein